jgi:hypothetical protein
MERKRAEVAEQERRRRGLAARLREQERTAINAHSMMTPLHELPEVPAVPAPEIDHRFSGLDAREPQGGNDVLASKLLRREPSSRLEKDAVAFVCSALRAPPVAGKAVSSRLAQKVPFSR